MTSMKFVPSPLRCLRRVLGAAAGLLLAVAAKAAPEVAVEGAEVGEWTQDYEAALALSAEEQLPVFLNFTGSDWCRWCMLMDEQVFSEPEWERFARENLVLVTLDYPNDPTIVPEEYKDRNQELQSAYGVRALPTYVLLEPGEEAELTRLGASDDATPDSFTDKINVALRTHPLWIERFVEEHPQRAEEFLAAVEEREGKLDELEEWLRTQPERTRANERKFENLQYEIEQTGERINEIWEG